MSFSYLAVFGAGLATFLSPCVLPLVPVLTANLISASSKNRWARLLSTLWFAIGFTAAFVLMGLGLSALLSVFPYAKVALLAVSAIFLGIFGLKMGGFIDRESKLNFLTRTFQMPVSIRRLPGGLHGLFLGAGFGLSWTPCVGPILGGVLTYVATQERSPIEGALLLSSFSMGIVLPLLGAALAADSLMPKLTRFNRFTPKIEMFAGYALVFFSIYLLNQAYLNLPLTDSTARQPVTTTTQGTNQMSASNSSQMLFFFSENCPVCHAMEQYLPKFEAECNSDNFKFVRINVDRAENSALAARFNVRAVPTISVLSPKGEEIIHLIGYQTEGRLREAASTMSQISCAMLKKQNETIEPEPSEGLTCTTGMSC